MPSQSSALVHANHRTMKMIVKIESATTSSPQPTAPRRDFTDSADACARIGIFLVESARGFFFLLNVQPWQLKCDQNPIARSRQRYVLFRRVSPLNGPGKENRADRKKSRERRSRHSN